ncbi:hypothetical protein FY528_04490 [Hymenobacter lutimineralis]|uniref:Uncharacterized protein n=1 Tax=Hymenobacter lutimineralis TaxID=2606448 RepID=A0A5D6V9B0_9BACT|nr:DUF6526 family protein [Hymenobacter lutimineralis]TYZ12561.1 hypothetical protein FY528_04490 [Hymenobacter lutimineralis]
MPSSSPNNRPTVRFYAPHHFILLPAALVMAFYAGRRYAAVAGTDDNNARLWFCVAAGAIIVLGILIMMRQHYALTLQDRIIRLEMRQRYFEITRDSFQPFEQQLTFKQIAALRYASDAELPGLLQAAIREKLSPAAIQERIDHVLLDTMRV